MELMEYNIHSLLLMVVCVCVLEVGHAREGSAVVMVMSDACLRTLSLSHNHNESLIMSFKKHNL